MAEEPKIKIEKGVPIPAVPLARRGRWKDHLRVMEVGDSFLVPPKGISSLRATIPFFIKNHAKTWQFVVKRDDTGRYRCWRLK